VSSCAPPGDDDVLEQRFQTGVGNPRPTLLADLVADLGEFNGKCVCVCVWVSVCLVPRRPKGVFECLCVCVFVCCVCVFG
jgi:hypothetical protein